MKFTKLLGLAIVLVALSVVINTLAYKTAVVTNGLSMTVSASNTAGLAFTTATSADPGINLNGTPASGKMTVTVEDDMQPDSVYTYEYAFKITNNATTALDLSYTATFTDGSVELLDSSDTDLGTSPNLAAGASMDVKLKVTVDSTATLGAKSASIEITGDRQ